MNLYTAIRHVSLSYALTLAACGGQAEPFPQPEPAPMPAPTASPVLLPPSPPTVNIPAGGCVVDGDWVVPCCDSDGPARACADAGAGAVVGELDDGGLELVCDGLGHIRCRVESQ